jgi:hypothetical protein
MTSPGISWPEGLYPEECPVFCHNELDCELSPQQLWPWLCRAVRWHEFYNNCHRLRILDDGGIDLQMGTRFRWWTFGVPVETVVDSFEPNRYLSWTGTGLGARGHHVWLLEPSEHGCLVTTEETQRGVAVGIISPLLKLGLQYFHQRWLQGLERVAHQGHPDIV